MLEETRPEPPKIGKTSVIVQRFLVLKRDAKGSSLVTYLISFIRAAKPTCSRGKFASFGE